MLRVSSAAMTSADAKISRARNVISRAVPMGVATKYKPAANFNIL
jgi:hypothetical protein